MDKCLVLFILLLVPCSTMSQNYIIDLTSEESIKNITSPNYPDHYYNNLDIVWQVIAPTGFRVMVQFNVFDLEEGFQGKLGDSLTVDHGFTRSLEDATPRALLSGSSQPDNISSIGSYLWLQFTSDGSVTEKGFSLSVRAVKPDWACDFKEDSCGLKNDEESWAIGSIGNYYYIRAIQDVSSFIIPHAYTSRKGTLSFAYFLSDRVSLVMLNVTVCKSQEPFPLGNRGIFEYEYITYSCHGIQDVEITFTATKDNNSTWINVHDIQLYSTSIPSTTSSSTIIMNTTPLQTTTLESTQSEVSSKGQALASSSTIIVNTTPLQTTTPESIKSEVSSKGPTLVGTSLSLLPILSSTLASLSAIAIIVLIVCLVCRQKRLKHVSSQGIAASGEPRESPGIKDNPTFDSPKFHDLQMSDVADCHGGNDPYIALTTPHGGPTFQVYQTLGHVNSLGDGYEVPINRANGLTGPEYDKSLHKLQVHPETDYEITHEYQDFSNSVVGKNHSHNESPVSGLQVQPETDYETTHDYEDPDVVGRNIPQYESRISGLQEMSKTDNETTTEYEDMRL